MVLLIDHSVNVPGNIVPQPKIAIIHQNLTFSSNAVMVAWSDRRCVYYQLAARQSCDLTSNTMVLINRTKEETITLEAEVLSNFSYFHLTAYDGHSNQCEDHFLELFQLGTGSKFVSYYYL